MCQWLESKIKYFSSLAIEPSLSAVNFNKSSIASGKSKIDHQTLLNLYIMETKTWTNVLRFNSSSTYLAHGKQTLPSNLIGNQCLWTPEFPLNYPFITVRFTVSQNNSKKKTTFVFKCQKKTSMVCVAGWLCPTHSNWSFFI